MNIEKRVLDKKRHGELVSAIDNVEKKITSEVTVKNPVESVSVENLDELKSVEVSNFPEQKEYPKSMEVKKPKWFSMKGIEGIVETGLVEVIKLLQKIAGKKIDLDEYKKANNALATRLVTRDGRDFYNAIMSGGGSLGTPRDIHNDFMFEVVKSNVNDHIYISKFGASEDIDNTPSPLCLGGNYMTPTVAQSLEVVSDSNNDTIAGTGGRTLFVEGLDENFDVVNETVDLNGTTEVPLTNTYLRVIRLRIASSGTYADAFTSSHDGIITVQEAGGGQVWALIGLTASGYGKGSSEIMAFTVRAGYTAIVLESKITADSNKLITTRMFTRENGALSAAPYAPMNLRRESLGITGDIDDRPKGVIGIFNEKTDILYMVNTDTPSVRASVSGSFSIMLIKNNKIAEDK